MKSNMATLGKEDASAMAAVEAHQQQMTLQTYFYGKASPINGLSEFHIS